ncbi:major outer membrane protein [Sulfurospirillum sp. 1307]
MKLAKLSLAAIMAVGAISAANATSLEDSIKGVNLSGYAHYRLHDASGAEAYSEIELRAQLTAPVQENIQFVTRFTADWSTPMNGTSGAADPWVDRLFFNYTGFDKTTVTLGRMYAGTPLDDTAALGLKVVSSPVKGLTLAAAYFTDNSAVTNALTAVAGIYANDMFNARAWYVMADPENSSANNGADFIFVEGGANVGPVALKAQYAQANPDGIAPTASTIRVQASAKMDAFGLRVGYVTNDKDAGDVTIDGSAEGDNDLIYGGIYGLVQINEADESAYFGEVSGKFGKFAAKAGYVSYDNGTYDDQYYGQVSYQMTKKFSTYVRYGSADPVAAGADDKTLARFHAQYNF